MKFKTVREGEQALVFNHLGESELIIGPKRVFLYRKRLQMLNSYTANAREYLILKDTAGVVKHKQGPAQVFHNTVEYDDIKVLPAINVDSNHIIIVYKRKADQTVERQIRNGPCLFVPEAEEWLHNFSWHGDDPTEKGRLIADKNVFTQLQTTPGNFYYNVKEVRTNDDTMIHVKLMLFYEICDIIKMLESTHDPIADLMNAICSDVIAFAGKLSFERFVERTSELSDLNVYNQLLQRAARIGFRIQKIVYRGYHSSDKLQEMQSSAIESRTKLRLNAEIQKQEQQILDLKLQKEQARRDRKNEMEKSKQDHKHEMDDLKQAHDLKLKDAKYNQDLLFESQNAQATLEHKEQEEDLTLQHLRFLSRNDVDLNKLLTSLPVKEEIRLVRSGK